MEHTSPETNSPQFSLIVPCYNEESNIGPVLEQIALAMKPFGDYEVLLVDDRSSDATWMKIQEAAEADPKVKGFRLSRNFGHQAALYAGMSRAAGDAIITLDADLQHPPQMIPLLIEKWENGAQVVNTVRRETEQMPLFKSITSRLFYKLFSFLSGFPLEQGKADFRLMDRVVVDAILDMKERKPFFRGLISWMGFSQDQIEFTAPKRYSGETKYTLAKMVTLALDGTLSHSYVPIRLSILAGLLMTLVAVAYGMYAITIKLFWSQHSGLVPGWASIIALLSLFFGVMYLQLGLVGEYIARIYIEGKTRPIFVIADHTKKQR